MKVNQLVKVDLGPKFGSAIAKAEIISIDMVPGPNMELIELYGVRPLEIISCKQSMRPTLERVIATRTYNIGVEKSQILGAW